MTHNIDIHILHVREPFDWVARTARSLSGVGNIWIVPGIAGELVRARSRAFSLGEAEYVSFADPDDTYNPEVFPLMAEALSADPGAAFAHSLEGQSTSPVGRAFAYTEEDFTKPSFFHGIIMFRREYMEELNSRCLVHPEVGKFEMPCRTRLALRYGHPILINSIGRVWVRRPGQVTSIPNAEGHKVFTAIAQQMFQYSKELRG